MEETMNKRKNLLRHLNTLLIIAIVFGAVLACADICIFLIDTNAGFIILGILVIYFAIFIYSYITEKKKVLQQFVDFATEYYQIQKRLIQEHVIPYAMLDESGKVIWMNDAFKECMNVDDGFNKPISAVIPTITRETLDKLDDSYDAVTEVDERIFRVQIKRFDFGEFAEEIKTGEDIIFNGYLYGIYLIDETKLHGYIKALDETQLVAGLIYIDNYDEVVESVEAVKQSMLVALIDRRINKYLESADGVARRIEKDKYYIIFKRKYLPKMQEDKFSLLQEVHAINAGNDIDVTLSIGIGCNPDGYVATMEYAKLAMELALGRGGDQAVVKEPNKIQYYGGSAKTVEKSTRVKARVKAHALREIIQSKDNVVVMGHKISDVDSFGAAIGIYKACEVLNKPVHIVLNEITTSVRSMVEKFMGQEGYPDDMFYTSLEAVENVDNNTAVVVVDVNKPSYCECSEILSMTKTVVILDHHRQSEEAIENPVLYYVEAYASSTCEMVAEILQYFDESIKLKNHEADCLYAGIMIDTNNFTSKAGVRTFEAAAYLRRCGADINRVRKMFRNDFSAYKAKAEVVRNAELYNGFAISVCDQETVDSPTIIAAQSANELLNIIGVKASVVLTEHNNIIYISARSMDEINVSKLMEKLGGGGHGNTAGAQVANGSIEEVKARVKELIDEMIREGEA
ncbi:MAG: DHH family phosphoesterase [Lachnospiraceae bacterium]|nr:DHH family phosphoesterase [Lachnospiraceae bacterium]